MNVRFFLCIAPVLLFSCSQKETPKTAPKNDTVAIEQPKVIYYGDELQQIDAAHPSAINQAIQLYKTNYAGSTEGYCDAYLADLKNFAVGSALKLGEAGVLDTLNKDKNGKISPEDERKFNRLGYLIRYTDNVPYFVSDPAFLLKNFEPCVSPAMKIFMEEFAKETEKQALSGDELAIEVTELQRRVLFWEDFLLTYPEFLLIDECNATYHFFLSLYMTGTGKSRAFIGDELHFNPEYKASYEVVIQNRKNTPTSRFIKDYYDVLKSSNFKMSMDVQDFVDNIKSPFARPS
jgi:hypothetical protein